LKGVELQTNYNFNALRWEDLDRPLSYSFGFLSSKNEKIVLKSKSLSSYTLSILPGGYKSSNYTVILFVKVFDRYSAVTTETTEVTVESKKLFTLQEIQKFSTENAIDISSPGHVDAVKKQSNFLTYLINKVNCSDSQDCSALHRNPCNSVMNTCGSCMKGFRSYTDDIDSNTKCIPESEFFSRKLREETNCHSREDCNLPYECREGICSLSLKECINNCSHHGQCYYISKHKNTIVKECRIDDNDCYARCECNTGYESESCSYTSEEWNVKIEQRKKCIDFSNYLHDHENLSDESVKDRINYLATLSVKTDEILNEADELFESIENLIDASIETKLNNDDTLNLFPSISSVTTAQSSKKYHSSQTV
jgi:hypothetical protein